jgi:hypothetical protein
MNSLWKSGLRVTGALFASGIFAIAQQTISAVPGQVNYVEGTVSLGGRSLSPGTIRNTQVSPGQVIQTAQGKVEVLLTPGVFVRLGDNSSLRMISPSLTNTEVGLERGRALVEVDLIQKEDHLDILDNGLHTVIEKNGIYRFDADQPAVAVYDGKAVVRQNDRVIEVGKGKELALASEGALKPQKFDRNQTDDLYAWSKLRSEYMASANLASAQTIIVNNPNWYGPGWFWNPWWSTWAFLPSSGFLYSPFGFGFYSPTFYYYNAPVFYRGGFGGFRGGTFPGRGFHPTGRSAPFTGSGGHFGGVAGGHFSGTSGGHFGTGRR